MLISTQMSLFNPNNNPLQPTNSAATPNKGEKKLPDSNPVPASEGMPSLSLESPAMESPLPPVAAEPTPTSMETPVATTTSSAPTAKVNLSTLLQNNSNSFSVGTGSQEQEQTITISKSQEKRFNNMKYKVYTFIMASLLLLVYSPISDAIMETWDKWESIQTMDETIERRRNDQRRYTATTDFIKQVDAHKDTIITCINSSQKCEELPDTINAQIDSIRAYLQMGSLHKDKMEVNESKILKSLNEFLTQTSDSTDNERKYNGTITNILIEDNVLLENNILQVPMHLTITFDGQEHLIDFLKNLEKRIFYDQIEWLNNSILYQIQEIKYDIVNHQTEQDVEVIVHTYAYNE